MRYGPSTHVRRWSITCRGWLFAMVLAAVAVLTAACGSSGSDQSSAGQEAASGEPSPVELVQVAYKKTASAKTAKVDFTSIMSGPPNGISLSFTGQGVVDFENQNANLAMQTPMGDIEMRQIGTVVYQRTPDAMRGQMPGQKPWVRTDLDEMMHERYGAGLSELEGNAPNDPAEQLGYLQGVSDSVEEIGAEEVRGEPTTHYHAIVHLEKAVEEQGTEEARQAYDELVRQLAYTTLPVDVWLDDEGRGRRFEMSMPLPNNAANPSSPKTTGEGQFTITHELYDFGTPVNVEPPPADQTVDFAELKAAEQDS